MAKKKTSSTKTEELPGSTGEVLPQAKDPVEAKLDLLIDLVKDMTKKIPFQGLDLSRYRFKED